MEAPGSVSPLCPTLDFSSGYELVVLWSSPWSLTLHSAGSVLEILSLALPYPPFDSINQSIFTFFWLYIQTWKCWMKYGKSIFPKFWGNHPTIVSAMVLSYIPTNSAQRLQFHVLNNTRILTAQRDQTDVWGKKLPSNSSLQPLGAFQWDPRYGWSRGKPIP